MDLTPFDGGLLPEGSDLKKFTDSKLWKTLDNRCRQHPIPNTLIAGPMGLGKSSLVRYYFTKERCRRLASERRNLVQPCHFSGGQLQKDEDVFLTLIEAVSESLNNLDRETEEYRRLRADFDAIGHRPDYAHVKTDKRAGRLLLEALTQRLREDDYCVTLILYHFQQLTCSETCAVDTFGAMANLVQKELISYIVITDCSIRVGSENYALSSFERILPGEPLIPTGVTGKREVAALQSAIRDALESWEEDKEEPIRFTDDELAGLWTLTAGIPGLLQGSLKALYRCREEERSALTWEDLWRVALLGCRDLMKQWTKHLDEPYWDTLGAILDSGEDGAITSALPEKRDRRKELRFSGLIQQNTNTQTWSLICPLFEIYLRQELERPREREDDIKDYIKQLKKYGGDGMIFHLEVHKAGEQTINLSGDYLAGGAVKHEQNLQVNAGPISVEEFLNRLGLAELGRGEGAAPPPLTQAEKLETYQRLSQQLRLSAEEGGVSADADPQESDHQIDLLIARAEREILPDVDPDTLENGSLENMEMRFIQIRAKMGLDEALNDRMMQTLSPLCRFYVEAALVVEDHMESIMFMLKDYSTHLVMYGKCLEQSLRDALFPMLKTHKDFCNYNTYVHDNTPGDRRTFGAMENETGAMLGSFYYILKERKRQLGALCARYGVTVPGVVEHPMQEEDWVRWWRGFAQKVRAAKNIRNRVHAGGSSPTREDLDELRRSTFGMDGVLHLSQVGRTLYDKLKNAPDAR